MLRRQGMLRRVPVAAALVAVFGFAVAASSPAAADTTGTTGTTSPTSTAAPAGGSMSLSIATLFNVKRHLVTVPKRRTTVHGSVSVYVPGQTVRVRLAVGRHVFATRTVTIRPAAGHGAFSLTYSVPRAGHVSIVATHAGNAEQVGFSASRHYDALSERVHAGSTGRYVQLVQARLQALHIYVPQSGVWDLHTQLAVDAYHRLIHRGHSESLDQATLKDLLNGVGRFHVRFPSQGRHAEGDLSTQLLALVDDSQVREIFPISSGKPSTPTVLGSYRIYSRVPGYLPDGMYYSDFFVSGYAIHGYDPAPNYPASHGCMRLPITDAITVYDWLAIGDWVDTYH